MNSKKLPKCPKVEQCRLCGRKPSMLIDEYNHHASCPNVRCVLHAIGPAHYRWWNRLQGALAAKQGKVVAEGMFCEHTPTQFGNNLVLMSLCAKRHQCVKSMRRKDCRRVVVMEFKP